MQLHPRSAEYMRARKKQIPISNSVRWKHDILMDRPLQETHLIQWVAPYSNACTSKTTPKLACSAMTSW
jgi:hypothetical protein